MIVACSDAFITAWSVQCSGKSDGAGSGGGTANCAVGAVAVFPGSDSESSEEQEGYAEEVHDVSRLGFRVMGVALAEEDATAVEQAAACAVSGGVGVAAAAWPWRC